MGTPGKALALAPVWGSLARRVGRDFRTLFRLEGMDGPSCRYLPQAELFLLLHRIGIPPDKPPGAERWGLVGVVQDKLHDQLRHQANQRSRDFERRTLLRREKDMVMRQDPGLAAVDAADERRVFLDRFLPGLRETRPELFRSTLAVLARLHIEESWDDQDLARKYPEYTAVRPRVEIVGKRSDWALERAGFGSVRHARKYLECKWIQFSRRTE
jgi:hypothetical protein